MGVLAIIITIIMGVVVLIAVAYTEFRTGKKRSDQKTDVPVVGDVLNQKQDREDAQRTMRTDDFNPGKA